MAHNLLQRISKGFCPVPSCAGRLLMIMMETTTSRVPEWVNQENARKGRPPSSELVEITTYTYKCIRCGGELQSTECLDAALTN